MRGHSQYCVIVCEPSSLAETWFSTWGEGTAQSLVVSTSSMSLCRTPFMVYPWILRVSYRAVGAVEVDSVQLGQPVRESRGIEITL